ncbi:putative methyltransferase [Antarctobacter heliothermus]|uniref:site-specific DNA-methyltransferase (adenine-specific) n=1 Tax=Antarctobacter heliothermus TaxID=74033 RepID=A0A222E4Y1_9RHOB|nr:site-specific DNA-methyltransferase [Antarctobacter heliothermus]ASP21255.1 putative methyltransferase [Antarctobacter heliothermus]
MTDEIEKLKMHSPDLTQDNIAKIRALFPGCVTEAAGEDGKLRMAVDFDQLRQELSDSIIEGPQERYHLNWPGKREALITANAPIAKTLRPARDESVDFDTTQNLFIEGDNLEALKLLQETYLGKVKMIYIDPPYNTGNDFVYDDDFADSSEDFLEKSLQVDDDKNRLVANTEANGRFHSDWLSMMYARLKLARSLLTENGMIFISIDDNEQSSLKAVCDEVFGKDNFVECFVWKKSYGGGPKEKYAVTQHEYVLMYARSLPDLEPFSLPYDPQKVERYYKGTDEHFEIRGPFRLKPLEATKSMDARPNLVYDVELESGELVSPQRQWLWGRDRVIQALKDNHVIVVRNGEKTTLNYKQYLRDENGVERGEKPFSVIDGIYTQHGTADLSKHFPEAVVVQFPKPVQLIRQFIQIATSSDPNVIVLDFFAGSGTTAEAVFSLPTPVRNQVKFVLVQIPEQTPDQSSASKAGFETIAEITKERIRRAGALSEISEGDVGFRVLKIDTSNMADVFYTPDQTSQADLLSRVDNVKPGRTGEDLLFQVLLDWGVDLTLPIRRETVQGKTVFFVADTALMACFDDGISEDLVKELAGHAPMRIVFKDTGFADDQTKINVRQIFKAMSPETEVKAI